MSVSDPFADTSLIPWHHAVRVMRDNVADMLRGGGICHVAQYRWLSRWGCSANPPTPRDGGVMPVPVVASGVPVYRRSMPGPPWQQYA